MKKSGKENSIRVEIFNVKLISNERSGFHVYKSIMKDLHEKKTDVNVVSDKHLRLRTQFEGDNIIYGKMILYTKLEEQNWYDEDKNEIVEADLDLENLHPNTRETDYFFIPEAHRFCFRPGKGISRTQVKKFLENGIPDILYSTEECRIIQEQAQDGFEKIFAAEEILNIKISLSYTNQDLTEEFEEALDSELRDSNVSDFEMTAKSPKGATISPKKSKMLKAGMSLAKSNGNVEARIINENKRSEKVITSEYPRKEKVDLENDQAQLSVRDKIMSIFRPNG